MNKQEIYQHLTGLGIDYEVTEHPAVYNMEELEAITLPHPEAEAKNLFLRDGKKRNYYMVTVPGDKRVDLKQFGAEQGLGKLSFGSAEDLDRLLGLFPGAVSPLGLLNDGEHRVALYLDRDFVNRLIAIHPNDNTATLCLQTADLLRVLTESGAVVHMVQI